MPAAESCTKTLPLVACSVTLEALIATGAPTDAPIEPCAEMRSTVLTVPLPGPVMPLPDVITLPVPTVLDVALKKNVPAALALEFEIVIGVVVDA